MIYEFVPHACLLYHLFWLSLNGSPIRSKLTRHNACAPKYFLGVTVGQYYTFASEQQCQQCTGRATIA